LARKISIMKRLILSLLLFFVFPLTNALAQGENPDFMRSIGKIYVVVAVIVSAFVGIVAFLIFLEKKLSKLENQINDHGKI